MSTQDLGPSFTTSRSDLELLASASQEQTAKVAASGQANSFQSGQSRAWGLSGNVD